jgi:transcriptional regulator with PAS, ATPase and Fis domain
VGNIKKEKAEIKVNQSFKVGEMTFTLEQGEPAEFSLSEKFQPDFVKEIKHKHDGKNDSETLSLETIYKEIEADVFQKGPRFKNLDEFITHLSSRLSAIPGFGALFLVEKKEEKDINIRFSINGNIETFQRLKEMVMKKPLLFSERNLAKELFSIPLLLRNKPNALVYFPVKDQVSQGENAEEFLLSLSKGIELLDKVLEEKNRLASKKAAQKPEDTEIITNSEKIKALIQQAKKIADSDIFILIEGESGTGKELFARLIHRHSKREQDKFVALNCAAIPENLLESELFGNEKGAFTGAYTQKKGKLELASQGTLVLDEIGDMPLNLQSKLLRAIQENEFYRLGGSIPIKVDLRIISLTHRNIEDLIKEKKFREDLYYRLVHRTLSIPPLRERKEDIPPLINYFTNKFCRRKDRSIAGYSVKAFEALVNFDWSGNVRHLENEINSIVNLTDDGETVDFDILSEKIKKHYQNKSEPQPLDGSVKPPLGFNRKPERDEIIEILKKNNWNKSKAAKELNMTYHGLHKKMKKLDISQSVE